MENTWARPVIAVLLILCSGAVYGFVMLGYANAFWKDIVNIIVGALVANLTAVVQYYFGSSKGSADKTAILADAVRKP